MRASLQDEARIKSHGYVIEPFTGSIGGFVLHDGDGHPLMVGDHGCISPTRWEAVAEALSRIEQDERLEREVACDRTNGRLDAAVIAFREEPTEANRLALLAVAQEHADHFMREQIEDYQERTHARS